MKKHLIVALVVVVLISVVMLISIFHYNYSVLNGITQKKLDELRTVNSIIKDEEFKLIQISNGTLILKNESMAELKKINCKITTGIKSIYREENQIYYTLNGSVDDSSGLLFVDKSSVDMSGLYKVVRISGDVFYYETYSKFEMLR